LSAALPLFSISFFSILPPPPAPPLFPYTTLFRSRAARRLHPARRQSVDRFDGDGPLGGVRDRRADPDARGPISRPSGTRAPGGVDRKSTRLNSSHVKISYAVFCLKKKKKKKHKTKDTSLLQEEVTRTVTN